LDFSAASDRREQGWKATSTSFAKLVMQSGNLVERISESKVYRLDY